MVAHMDWYRLETVDEIEMLGVREYFQPPWICLIEWPERAMELLDDTVIHIAMTFPASDPDSRWIGITSPHYS